MKAEDLRSKTPDELQKLLLDARKEQMNQRFQRTGGQLENTAQIRKQRREIARIKTIMTSKLKGDAQPAKKAQPEKTKAKAKSSKKAA